MMDCDLDWDDFFAYRTPKVVIMRDRYLGMLHYSFMGGIFGYIVIYVIIVSKGYLEEDFPITASRLTLREPSGGGLPPDLNQCDFTAKRSNIPDLPYCSQMVNSTSKIPCEYADWQAVIYPHDQPDAIFVTTSNTVTVQQKVCDPRNDPTCYYPFKTLTKEEYYIANIENFTIGVFHSVRANKFYDEAVSSGDWDFNGNPYKQADTAASNGIMNGKLKDIDGSDLCDFSNSNVDVLPIRRLLDGAGVPSLDDISTVDDEKTIRSEGMVITLSIDYNNRNSKNYTIGYTYRSAILPQISYKVEEPVLTYQNGQVTGRIIYNRHGIKFIILPTGTIYRFNFQVLLVQLVSGLALLAAATTVVDLLALKVMPMRKHYQNYKMEVTADFSDVRGQIVKEDARQDQANPGTSKYMAMA
eukprot:TRINITY_DN6771_c0_g2_i1.p1 TRINITY_DN6771_c0_g2~~TRINITY_DN6771_c0_g2_i1.p1  ORF type:complete len:413 (-),score=101.93 TRINITY_DN6771_c0_g2_i1:169-1407(-)